LHFDRGRTPGRLPRTRVPPEPADAAYCDGSSLLAVQPAGCLQYSCGASRLAIGVRAAGGVRGVRGGPARDWCRRAVATHRVAAWVMASAALDASAALVASTRQRDALSPAGLTIATLVYVSFAVIAIVRWPPWLLAGVPTLGAVASMAAGSQPSPANSKWQADRGLRS
jgi:hypothetical protein